jgi:hypothetical protein
MTKCVICLEPCENFGRNAWPFIGRCCDACNLLVIIPARLRQITEDIEEAKDLLGSRTLN